LWNPKDSNWLHPGGRKVSPCPGKMNGEPGLNYLCRGLKAFYAHALPEVDRIVANLRQPPIRKRR